MDTKKVMGIAPSLFPFTASCGVNGTLVIESQFSSSFLRNTPMAWRECS
jgi:hypothetical protein